MILASIDLMGGRAVQLRQGRERVLTDDRDPVALARAFSRHGPVAIVDLDAALGQGDNHALVERLCRVAECRVGGGIRDLERARALLQAGASRLVIGTAATPELLAALPRERVVVALDHRRGEVLDRGWTRGTGEDVEARATRLAPHCGGFLVTFVEHEGCLEGIPRAEVERLVRTLPRPLTVAGGVASTEEAASLARLGCEVQVGMALYTGRLDLAEAVAGALALEDGALLPTVVQEASGDVLMLAWSSRASLVRALREGKGVYWSRSRQELWEKGATSGNHQELLACRVDCDRDALLFTVRQAGPACHLERPSCFGDRRFGLAHLMEVLRDRQRERPEGSYVAGLLADRARIHEKILEEAGEVVRTSTREELRWEAADLVFHLAVRLVEGGLDWAEVEQELAGRHAARRPPPPAPAADREGTGP